MKKPIYILLFLSLMACQSARKTQKAVNAGNYPSAMNRAIDKLTNNKERKSNQVFVVALEESFAKYTEQELRQLRFLEKENLDASLEERYNILGNLTDWQERIRPLLPLRIQDERREARFRFTDYSDQLLRTKTALTEFKYNQAVQEFGLCQTKGDFRRVHQLFEQVDALNPGYKETISFMEKAHEKGLQLVFLNLENRTEQVLPQRLVDELLDIDQYGLETYWTQYHTQAQAKDYDYQVSLDFDQLFVSPERIIEKQISREKQIVDGVQFLRDNNGEVVKDSLGNKIEVDRLITVRCDFYKFRQFKEANLGAQVRITNNRNGQLVKKFPLQSGFIFEHIFARFEGDQRAFDDGWLDWIRQREVAFPSNEQMIYDAGEDLKAQFKSAMRQVSLE